MQELIQNFKRASKGNSAKYGFKYGKVIVLKGQIIPKIINKSQGLRQEGLNINLFVKALVFIKDKFERSNKS